MELGNSGSDIWRGVNLGGWLVLERWIAPEVFDGLSAGDESDFCHELGELKVPRLQQHRATFITEEDFAWIASQGLNAVRIPVPHWVFGDVDPYVGCIEYLDFAVETAGSHGLGVLIDLHTAPGSQNGYDHSGVAGRINWHKDHENITFTHDILERIAERYRYKPNLMGIELLNEPSDKIPHETLLDFYKQAYRRVRNHCGPEVSVVVSDAFRPHDWSQAFDGEYESVILDMHLYQAFGWHDKRTDMHGHLDKALHEWDDLIREVQENTPVIIGEWSLGLDPRAFRGMDEFERDKALQAYGAAQLKSFKQSRGWFFWNYKTSNMAGWSLRDCVSRGWLKLN